jgi:hypothetical protein
MAKIFSFMKTAFQKKRQTINKYILYSKEISTMKTDDAEDRDTRGHCFMQEG